MDLDEAFAAAVAAGDADAVARLFAAGVDPASLDDVGTPYVLVVADGGDVALVRAFLDAGFPIDSDAGHELGTTALICAARGGHLPLAELLLARGADPDVVERGDVETGTALTWAMMELPDPTAMVTLLLDAGADPSVARPDGWTPLMLAAHQGREAMVRQLLEAGADLHATAFNGELNALSAARDRSRPEVVALLLERGAVEAIDPDTERLAVSAAEMEQWLARRGSLGPAPDDDPDAVDRLGVIVDGIKAWFAEHAPPAAVWIDEARGGADPAAAEAVLGVRLPASFRAYLRLFGGVDGLNIAEYDGLSLTDALHVRAGLEGLRTEGTFATWGPREVRHDNGFVRYTWWHPAWLPFAQDGGGNLYCVDLDPGERGTVGQVISWEIHGGPAGPIVPSMEEYLRRYLDRLHAGEYEFNPLTGHQD